MTQVYRNYLTIARLVAKRARLCRLCEMYPADANYSRELVNVSKELMRHQTEDEVTLTEDDMRVIINAFM